MTVDEALPESRRKEVVRQGVSVGVATGLYGVSFGALSVASGLSVLQTQALSLLMFTGGSQFALVGIIGAGGSGTSAIATASLLGIRNGLYALQVSQFLKAHGPKRMLAAHITIDESTAVGIGQEEPAAQRIGFWVTGLAVLAGWNLMTFVGALAGNALGDPKTWGLDAAAAGAFCALLWPRLATGDGRAAAVLAAFIALLTIPLVPAGIPVILAAVGRSHCRLDGARSSRARRGRPPRSGPDAMNTWTTVLVACALAFVLKFSGFVVPARLLEGPRISRISALLPAALLSGLIVTQTFAGSDGRVVLDARLAAVGVAGILLWRKANFLVVVGAAAATAALLRLAGWS